MKHYMGYTQWKDGMFYKIVEYPLSNETDFSHTRSKEVMRRNNKGRELCVLRGKEALEMIKKLRS